MKKKEDISPVAIDTGLLIEKVSGAEMSRRSFLGRAGLAAGGLIVGAGLAGGISGMEMLTGRALAAGHTEGKHKFDVFVSLGTDGTIHFTCHRSEMGQQIRTSLAMIVADEMEADFSRFRVNQGDGDPAFGDQNTDGSRSVRRNFTRLRRIGATVRAMLETAAAEQWGVASSDCTADNHYVVHAPSGQKLSFGELAEKASKLEVPAPDSLLLKKRSQWRYIGKAHPSIDLTDVLTGQAKYGIDIQLDGMKVAVVARPPVVFGRVESFEPAGALAVKGVERVVELPALEAPSAFKALGGIAVIAKNTWAAIKGRAALKVTWEDGANAVYNSVQYKEDLLQAARTEGGDTVRAKGDVDAAFKRAAKTVSADYYVPHITHAAMEPPMATAHVKDGKCEIWASTQTPQATRATVAAALGLKPEDVTVHVTFLGGGFGRKSKPDYSVEAALLSRQVGAPVKVVWTREDDIQHSYYHAVSAQHISAALDEDGKTTAWKHKTMFPTIGSTFDAGQTSPGSFELDLGFKDNPFQLDNMALTTGSIPAHVRIGWVRSVCNIFHAFAVQSFAAELAVAAGRDQKDYLLDLIGSPRILDLKAEGVEYGNYGDPIDVYPIDTGRLAGTLRRVADDCGWDTFEQGSGRGLGIAVHRSFLTYVATAVEVAVEEDGQLRVVRAWTAIDAGTVVNPEHVRAQCEGGTIYGLSCALMSEVTATGGRVDQSNYHDYLVARMPDSPFDVHVSIMENDAAPAGVGEPSTPPALAALTNAIYNATGKRIRQLPVGDQLSV